MSGSGKSAAIRELAARGYRAVDLDTPEWSHWIEAVPADALTPAEGRDWVWQEARVRPLLAEARAPLFVSGCCETMGDYDALIDLTVLLTAPLPTLLQRLAERREGYGRTPGERERVAALVDAVEPLLRASADAVIDTRQPVATTVDAVLRLLD